MFYQRSQKRPRRRNHLRKKDFLKWAKDLLLIQKYGHWLFYVYCSSFCRQIYEWAANLGAYLKWGIIARSAATIYSSSWIETWTWLKTDLNKAQDSLLFRKFDRLLFHIYCPSFCRQIFKWVSNLWGLTISSQWAENHYRTWDKSAFRGTVRTTMRRNHHSQLPKRKLSPKICCSFENLSAESRAESVK